MRTNLERYFEDIRATERTIFGRRLFLLTVGHFAQLNSQGSVFLSDAGLPEVGDVALVLSILDGPPEATGDPSIRHLKRVGRKLMEMPLAERLSQTQSLLAWLADQFRFPKFWTRQAQSGEGRPLGAPWFLRMKVALALPEAEFVNLPLAEALYRWFALLESEGQLDLRTDEENSILDEEAGAPAKGEAVTHG